MENCIADPGEISWDCLLVQSTSSIGVFPCLFTITKNLQSHHFSKTQYICGRLSFPCWKSQKRHNILLILLHLFLFRLSHAMHLMMHWGVQLQTQQSPTVAHSTVSYYFNYIVSYWLYSIREFFSIKNIFVRFLLRPKTIPLSISQIVCVLSKLDQDTAFSNYKFVFLHYLVEL